MRQVALRPALTIGDGDWATQTNSASAKCCILAPIRFGSASGSPNSIQSWLSIILMARLWHTNETLRTGTTSY